MGGKSENDQSVDRNHRHNSISDSPTSASLPSCPLSTQLETNDGKKCHNFREILMWDLIFARFKAQLANRNKFHPKPETGANLNY